MHLTIRPADKSEAAVLTDLALKAKAVWGYDAAFMARCRDELQVTPEMILSEEYLILVAETAQAVVGFASLEVLPEKQSELEALFVDPGSMRKGVGLALWHAVVEKAVDMEIARIEIQSDPNALPFYLAVGCRQVGERASHSIPGRSLPLVDYCL